MYNRRYEKVFLMLRQETAGYALGKRQPWGSSVMELKNGKGRLHVSVQGLQPRAQGYAVYVMAGRESIFCGELHPDSREGNGTLDWAFLPDALGDGKTAEDLHTVLVLAADGGGFSAPLTAYFKERVDWRKDFVPRKTPLQETAPQKAIQEEIELHAAEAAALMPPEVHVIPKTDTNAQVAEEQKKDCHGSFQGLLAKFRRELEHLEDTGIFTKEETAKFRQAGAATPAPLPGEQIEAKAEEPVKTPVPQKPAAKTEGLFAKNLELEPFGDGVQWKCLSLEELVLLSQVPLRWQREFFFLLPYRRYHHLILKEEGEGVWLGLPSAYAAADAETAAAFGFGEFRRVEEDWGYWLAFLKWEG